MYAFGLVLLSCLDFDGLYIQFPAMRRVLHLKMVSQCAMLEDFGIFLVLADKVRTSSIVLT